MFNVAGEKHVTDQCQLADIMCFIQFVVSSSGFFSLLFVAFLLYLQRCLESRVLNISRVLKVLKSCVV